MNRRHLLQLTAALAGGHWLALSSLPTSTAQQVAALFGEPRRLRRIAHACPDLLRSDDAALWQMAGLPAGDTGTAALTSAFAARRSDDFVAGRIRTIEGWVVAESECALCTLVTRSVS